MMTSKRYLTSEISRYFIIAITYKPKRGYITIIILYCPFAFISINLTSIIIFHISVQNVSQF